MDEPISQLASDQLDELLHDDLYLTMKDWEFVHAVADGLDADKTINGETERRIARIHNEHFGVKES